MTLGEGSKGSGEMTGPEPSGAASTVSASRSEERLSVPDVSATADGKLARLRGVLLAVWAR